VSHGSAGWAFGWPPGPLTGEIRPSSHKERRQAPGEGEPQQHEGPVYSITGLVKLAIARGVLTIEDAGLAVEGEVVRADPLPPPPPEEIERPRVSGDPRERQPEADSHLRRGAAKQPQRSSPRTLLRGASVALHGGIVVIVWLPGSRRQDGLRNTALPG
jgi:hypothetical protein